jgi:outer membrane protein
VTSTSHTVSISKAVARIAGLLLVASSLCGPAQAQEVAAPMKVAVLDMAGALFNSERAKAVDDEIQTQTAEDEARVRQLAEEGRSLQEKLQQDSAVMSDDEKRRTAERIEEIGVQYNFLIQKLQTLVQERRQVFQETHAQALYEAIRAVVEEGQYDIVYRAEAMLHYRTEYDITARVTEKLNQQP